MDRRESNCPTFNGKLYPTSSTTAIPLFPSEGCSRTADVALPVVPAPASEQSCRRSVRRNGQVCRKGELVPLFPLLPRGRARLALWFLRQNPAQPLTERLGQRCFIHVEDF